MIVVVHSGTTGGSDPTLVTSAPGAVAPVALARGAAIGRYLVLDVIGSGGMGTVVLADDPELDRRIALKLVDAHGRPHGEIVREAQALARLSHPNVVTVHDVGREGDKVYIAMEYVRGETLRAWQDAGPRSIDERLAVYLAAGRGLAAAHAAGVVHRDFKPDNAIVGHDGVVRVLDFGLATTEPPHPRTDEQDTPARRSDPVDAFRGTPAYMAPEQRLGLPADAAADQYAFAVSLVEALCGQRPAAVPPAALARGEATELPPAASGLPLRIRRALQRALATAPADRFPGMTPLLDSLQAASPRRRRGRALLVLALGGLAASSFGVARLTDRPVTDCSDTAAMLASVWGPQTRGALVRAFDAVDVAWAETTRTTVVASIDAWAQTWAQEREATCIAGFREGGLDPAEARRRIDCLDDHLERVGALVQLFASADAQVLARAVDAAAGLPEPQVCAEAPALDISVPPPDTRELVEEVRRIRAALSQVDELAAAEHFDEARPLAEQLLREASATGYEPIRVRALRTRAYAESDPDRAIELHLVGIAAAIALGDRPTAARGCLSVAQSLAELDRLDDARRWGRITDALTAALDDDRLQLAAAVDRANMAARRGDWIHARVAADTAVAIAAAAFPADSVYQIAPLVVLANVTAHTAPGTIGVEAAQRAAAIATAAYGDEHPRTVATRRTLAAQYIVTGELEQALPLFAADVAAAAARDPNSRDCANARWNYAVALLDAGRWRQARDELDLAAAIYLGFEGRDGEAAGQALGMRAAIALGEDDFVSAREYGDAAIAAMRRLAPGRAALGAVLHTAAVVALNDGRDEDARARAVEALAVLTPTFGPDHASVLETNAALALAELRLGVASGRTRLEQLLPRAAALTPAIARVRVEVYALAALRLAEPARGEVEWRALGEQLSRFGLAGEPVRGVYRRLDAWRAH